MASTADFRIGLCLEFNDQPHQILDFQHVKPGKGPAFVRTKLKNLKNGKIFDHTWNSGVKVNTIRVEHREHQYLYSDDNGYVFMNNNNFEQVSIPESLISNGDLMKEGIVVEIVFDAENEEPLSATLPAKVELEVTYTEQGLKGDTATNTLKPATVETGAEVRVPLFINTGDKIKVDTATYTYAERVK
ncbi:MAG: elongation factor P [Bacteroidota bacterium]|nr:elongation factor P [Bacteroidota bacterium]